MEVLDAWAKLQGVSIARAENLYREGDRLIDGSVLQVCLDNNFEVHVERGFAAIIVTTGRGTSVALLDETLF